MTARSRLWIVAPLVLAACVPAEAPPAAPEPEAPAVRQPPAEIALEERVRAPFAVQTVGRIAAREPEGEAVEPEPVAWGDAAIEPAPLVPEDPEDAVAPPADPAPTGTQPRDGFFEHEVQAGESFWSISRRYGIPLDELADANLEIDPGRLRVGDVLRVPGEGAQASPAPATQDGADPPASQTYEVRPGDTLWGIARRFGVSMDAIRRANDLEGDAVRLGQILVIPDEE
jgi:LysM repeat protein